MREIVVFVMELVPVDAPSASTIAMGDISALHHEMRDDSME